LTTSRSRHLECSREFAHWAWQGQIYLSILNELHGGPANLNVQTASNLDLAKVRDHKLTQFLCLQYACDVLELMRDDDPASGRRSGL
jgi:hypothetical protein